MTRTWRFRIGFGMLVVLAGASLSSFAADGDTRLPTLHLRSGDYVSGTLLDSADDGHVSWQSAAFAQPLVFAIGGVHSVQFPLPDRRAPAAGPYCFELSGGDAIHGGLVSLDERQAVLGVPGLGTLHVDRAAVHRFFRTSAADLIFAGPSGLDGWKATGPENAWRDEAGQLKTDQPGAAIRRDFRPPPLARYEVELSWTQTPNFELAVGLSEDQPDRAGFRLETWGDSLVVTRETEKQADLALLQTLQPGAGQVRVLCLFDQPRGRLLVFSSAGEKLADFTVPESTSAPLPKATKSRPGLLLRAPTNKPELPGGLRLTNRRGDIKLERLTINRWSGVAPQLAAAGQATIHLTDGTIRSGEVLSLAAGDRQLVVRIDGSEQRLDERTLHDVVLSQPGEASPRAVRVLLASGARLSGELLNIGQERITIRCPGIQEPLALGVNDLQAVSLLGAEAAMPETDADAAAAPAAAGEARLELPGVSLRGLLLDARAGEHSCLVFQPRYCTAASPLAADVSGKLVLREPSPPPPPVPVRPGEQSPGVQIVQGMRSLLGIRQAPGMRPAPPGDCLLHLRSGDTFPCRVQFIDERGITFKSTVTDASFVAHERIKALELRVDARPVKIEKAKFERLLTLPRMQRDNPPEQLIRSLAGDYLRGRLLSMNDQELQIELHLEPKTIPRQQVSRVLWLHPDEAAKATASSPPPQSHEEHPPGIRVQAVPKDGHRLTFFAQEFSGKTLSGESDVLGACRVHIDQIDQLLIGGAIDEAASGLAFHQWKLRPAAEPLPDPEPGSGSGSGMESVLVGKPAPEIDLDLLDGKKFRLADRQGKIVVLDFWASWCGPCLQAMPQVDAVAREFAEQGVELVAINLQESPEQIRTALARLKLETPVALDRDGRVAERYGATAIPQTVIIDKDGTVARLFVGGGARFDEQLREALQSVLKPAAVEAPAQD